MLIWTEAFSTRASRSLSVKVVVLVVLVVLVVVVIYSKYLLSYVWVLFSTVQMAHLD